jgi:hypothetical protein
MGVAANNLADLVPASPILLRSILPDSLGRSNGHEPRNHFLRQSKRLSVSSRTGEVGEKPEKAMNKPSEEAKRRYADYIQKYKNAIDAVLDKEKKPRGRS